MVSAAGTALIGLDWGTTSLRAYRIDRRGQIRERRASEAGILKVPGGDFAAALEAMAGDWLAAAPAAPILAAGMIGSRQGWQEVPYLPCPAGGREIATALAEVAGPRGRTVHLVPGLCREAGERGFPDVMRGEETQILGALAAGDATAEGIFVLPGTHSKWAWVTGGRITGFATYMTGELFEVLTRHSILGRLMEGHDPDADAFATGLARAGASAAQPPGHLLHDLFSARTLGLFSMLPPTGIASYLSGLLIGAEVAAAMAGGAARGPITILASGTLSKLYAAALTARGIDAGTGDTDAAAKGLYVIARAAGLIEENDDD